MAYLFGAEHFLKILPMFQPFGSHFEYFKVTKVKCIYFSKRPTLQLFIEVWVTRQLFMIRKQEPVEKYFYFTTKNLQEVRVKWLRNFVTEDI